MNVALNKQVWEGKIVKLTINILASALFKKTSGNAKPLDME